MYHSHHDAVHQVPNGRHCHILTHAESDEKGMFGMVTALVVS